MTEPYRDFIRDIIDEDMKTGKFDRRVMTRFPPEPNGYLHLGHAKSICLNFGVATEYGGLCNLRFDDTNPVKENEEYVHNIQRDVKWLGFDWDDRLYFASDYFEQLYTHAITLIKRGKAYVDSLSQDEIRAHRGAPGAPGIESPYRDRPVEENLALFRRMREGAFADGTHVLRAKIDMAHPNLVMRDPVLYRIRHAHHHRTGDNWPIYPMYDYTHCLSDSIEGVTHSLCTWEFEINRPLYDWILDALEVYHPQQIEFAPLNVAYTILSKRLYRPLIEKGILSGWDDPRVPTIAGMRRRGYTPASIRAFMERVGVAKKENLIDMALFEYCIREDLNKTSPRVLAVLRPLKVVVINFPEDQVETFDAVNNPEDASMGTRKIPFCREIFIERDDFEENPPKGYFRLAPGQEVRLRYAYYITCTDVVKDADGNVVELRCTYDPASSGGGTPDGRKVKGTIHWVSARHAIDAEVRLYDRLFNNPEPDVTDEEKLPEILNPGSLETLSGCRLEPSLAHADPGSRYQFERIGYFCADSEDSRPDAPVFNRTVTLRDTWAKLQKKDG
ncbi:MAG: glutamine--tRNA ligase/YqeY domain fusion protein [candidate division Zixibacteria bacterium]|nr:glutamine--tRNA ligase/YqeY domain fusion protein [candidate division Zixibacteria bacterium]